MSLVDDQQAIWAQACKMTVEIMGRVTAGADLACEMALEFRGLMLSIARLKEQCRRAALAAVETQQALYENAQCITCATHLDEAAVETPHAPPDCSMYHRWGAWKLRQMNYAALTNWDQDFAFFDRWCETCHANETKRDKRTGATNV